MVNKVGKAGVEFEGFGEVKEGRGGEGGIVWFGFFLWEEGNEKNIKKK